MAAEISGLIRSNFTAVPADRTLEYGVGQSFPQAQNNFAGIRAPHAREALANAESVDRWGFGGDTFVTLGLSAPTPRRTYSALVVTYESPIDAFISEAWRLYGDVPPNATDALAHLLAELGANIRIHGVDHGPFIAQAVVDGPADLIAENSEAHHMSGQFKARPDGKFDVVWAYGLHTANYLAAVAKHR